MATYKELNEYYKKIFQKDFPSATLGKWVKEGKIKAVKQENGRYNYDLEDFIKAVNRPEYKKQIQAKKENPEDYIGKIKGKLLIKGIVPKEEYLTDYKGTLMYCDCLSCGEKNIQVRFTYLSDNGNYNQLTCGCGRKIRAFLASARKEIDEDYLYSFNDFEKFLFIHKMLTHIKDNYYGTKCNIEEYKKAIEYFYNDIQFNKVYSFWKGEEKGSTFYDLAKPSLDHILPLSKGGTSELKNLQVLTVLENLMKRDMTMEEWNKFKKETETQSKYFIESILKGGDVNE